MTTTPTPPGTDAEVCIVREFAHPRERVFAAWTNAEAMLQWFAPSGCMLAFCEVDARPGGALRTCVTITDGKSCWTAGTFLEVVAPERLAFQWYNTDDAGRQVNPIDLGMDPEWPSETTVTVTFEDLGERTRLTLRQSVSAVVAQRTGALPSWFSIFDRCDGFLASSS